ncbi:hypothetical protein RHMOL_Rhmol06G0249700 [Rhododendron molle]|uniref:Uncharacterized protein n=1 Tax=Rhododendron molle TaxID=49168 RepID=A0ACC0NGQ0_RHOML|nr:hypothetical protein RHMOL_Rhmol06G0249700 [Rhododendron molle]
MSKKKKKVRWIKHYNSAQKILLVGEGDFSFSACLARAFGSGRNMVATSLHSKRLLAEKHWSSEEHLEELESLGCLVLHKVNVHKMSYHHTLKHMEFDVVVFNFPHAGHVSGYTEKDEELIEMHKDLLRGFFKSARGMLVKEGGEVHVTHRDDYPYNKWELEVLGAESGFCLKERVRFEKGDYPGLLAEKHWSSEEHLVELESLGCLVLHKVNVHKMSYHHTLKHMEFDVVVFNFPHAGHVSGYTEKNEELIEMHKDLLRGFFKSARGMLVEEGGEVHVTHRDDYPYNKWELEVLGAESGFSLQEKVRFEKRDYPGYHNKRGGDSSCNKTFPLGFECFTLKFSVRTENVLEISCNRIRSMTLN